MDLIVKDEEFDKKEFKFVRKVLNLRGKVSDFSSFHETLPKKPTRISLHRETGDHMMVIPVVYFKIIFIQLN